MNEAQTMQKINMLLQAIGGIVRAAEQAENVAGQAISDKIDSAKVLAYSNVFLKSQDGHATVTKDNSAFYYCESQNAALSAAKYLQYNEIPALVVRTEHDRDKGAIIMVPKQYESEADKFIGEANKVLTKTELNRNEFFAVHLGEKIVEFGGVTENQLRLMRDSLADKQAEFCVARQSDGTYKVITTTEDRPEIARAAYEAHLNLNGSKKDEYALYCESRQAVEKRIIDAVAFPKDGKDLVLMDYAKRDQMSIRVQPDRLIEYGNKEPSITLKKDAQEFSAKLIAASLQMKAPIIGETDTKSKISNAPRMEDVCARQEIAARSQDMARTDVLNGHAETAEGMATKIVSLMIASEPNNSIEKVSDVINSTLKTAELAVWAQQAERARFGTAELKELCDKTSEDVTVNEAVLQFAREDINYILESKNRGELTETERDSNMTELSVNTIVNDIVPHIVTVKEFVEETERNDREYPESDEPKFSEPDFYDEPDVPEIPIFNESRPSLTGGAGDR